MTKPTAATTAAPPRPSFLDQVEDSTQLAMGAKIQVWGGPETGKSHDAYENLPRPLIVVDSDVSAGLFNDDPVRSFVVNLAGKKMNLPADQLLLRAVLANWFVCLAVWMAARIKSETARILMIW